MSIKKQIPVHGHRGARGLLPENTIAGFLEAARLGVQALEIDVVISKDLQVVVSHEPWMNELFCTQPNGSEIESNSKEKYNLYQMPFGDITAFDCGLKVNPEFPFQKSLPSRKPLLSEVICVIEDYINKNSLSPIIYNIEIKSDPSEYGIFQPDPETFVWVLFKVLLRFNITDRVIIQSFDVTVLQEVRKRYPGSSIGLLIENAKELKSNIEDLGFTPSFYNPDFHLVNEKLVSELHSKHIKIIPWTVNEITDMQQLIGMGVDGLITDYPDRALELIRSL